MAVSLAFEELLGYSDDERAKWERWLAAEPSAALDVPVQREGRFQTVWDLLDHIFLVEKRHTQRLRLTQSLATETGVARGDSAALFAYARAARADLLDLVRSLGEAEAALPRDFDVRGTSFRMTPRKLLFHILLHETRHLAQVATALRNGGFQPPGDHDLFYAKTIE